MIRGLAFAWSGRHLPLMSDAAWARWTEGARVLAQDRLGLRTMRTADGRHAVKEFGLRRVLSSAVLHPYAMRFAENCAECAHRGIAAPRVTGLWRRREPAVHVVVYEWREGCELREALKGDDAPAIMTSFGRFLAQMHDAGADFGAGHLGNFLVETDGTISLLDCVDVTFSEGPLEDRRRGKMLFYAMTRYPEDDALLRTHAAALARGYFGATRMNAAQRQVAWDCMPCAFTSATGLQSPPQL